MKTRRLLTAAASAAALALLVAAPAGAHVSGDKSTVAAGSYTTITLTVPHGCEESPTRAITVGIPEGAQGAAPQVVAGWDVATETAPVEVTGEDGTVSESEQATSITWTAQPGNELPSAYRQVFTVGFKATDEVGQRLEFPVTQLCTEGRTDWDEPTVEGEEEPEHPAPFVDVTEAEGDGHGHGSTAEEPDDEGAAATDEAAAPADPVAASTSSDDGGSDGVAIAGVAVGALGLLVGGLALFRTKSS